MIKIFALAAMSSGVALCAALACLLVYLGPALVGVMR